MKQSAAAMARTVVVAGLVALTLCSCGTLSTWKIDPADLSAIHNQQDLDENVRALADPIARQRRSPGFVIGVLLPDGSNRFFGYGVTEQGGEETPGPDTLFAVGSLSKGFLGAVTSTLVQDGQLSWSDPLPSFFPRQKFSEDAASITVEQLATHTSGLPRQPQTLEMLTFFTQYLFTGDNFYRNLDRDAIFDYLSDFSRPSVLEPRYSNIGYGVLGSILEERTGRSLDALLAERITGPLGLTHTGYDPTILPGFSRRARGYAGDQPKFIRRGDPVPDWQMTDILRGSAALHSTARDLLGFAEAHVEKTESKLNRALVDTLRVRYPRTREAASVAWIGDDVAGIHITYQIGIIAGYTSYLALNEANHTAVVVLQNAFNWDYSLGHKLILVLADKFPAR